MPRHKQFDTVPLPNGASVVCLDLVEGTEPPLWIVEVFNTPGSMGDGVTDMWEGPEGLVALNQYELDEILRRPPNITDPVKA